MESGEEFSDLSFFCFCFFFSSSVIEEKYKYTNTFKYAFLWTYMVQFLFTSMFKIFLCVFELVRSQLSHVKTVELPFFLELADLVRKISLTKMQYN